MTPDEREAVEHLLVAEREGMAATEAGLVAELAAIVEASEGANLDDEHDPEGSTVAYERARVASLLDAVHTRAADIAAAVERLQTGTYGRCSDCGEMIAPDRLSAYPTAAACVSCLNGPPAGRPVR